jgi:Tol biopolymer transport system component
MTDSAQRLSSALADRYVIERELGAGGMATVYLAHDVRHDRKVALKVLRPELSAILGGERFLAEIKTTANLQHPHILSLFDSGIVGSGDRGVEFLYYVMPYVEGESLRERLSRDKQLPVDEAVRIAREVADALQYAHQHGIVHRDIKPENILLHGGHAQVADFGIALAASRSDGGSRMTETGMSLGTPHYMAPEQAMGEREITPRADIYALGCVLYEMLTAEPPFVGATAQAIIARVMTEEPRSLTLQRRTIPPHVEAAVVTALQKLPADRFATAAAFADAVGRGDYALPATRAGAATRSGGARRRSVTRWIPWAVAAIAGVVAGWTLLRPAPPAPVVRYGLVLPDSQGLHATTQRRIAIAPDGRLIVYVGPGPRGRQLWLRRRDGLLATPIAGTDGASNPAFSPDGARVAFVAGTPRGLRVVSLSGGTPTVLTDSLVDLGGVSWGPDGYIYYDGHLEGDGVARIRATGGRPEIFTRPNADSGESYHNLPYALPGGHGVLFTVRGRTDREWTVAVADVETGRHTVLAAGASPLYAPTGHLLYLTETGALMAAPFDERRLRVTGDAVEAANGLAVRGNARGDVALSETGTLLYVMGSAGGQLSELVWVTRDGAVTAADPFWRERFGPPALSPDGARIAVAAGAAGNDLWIKTAGGGPPRRLTFDGRSLDPNWTPDGRGIVFRSAALPGAQVMTAPADGGALPRPLRELGPATSGLSLTRDGRWLVFNQRGDLFGYRMAGDTSRVRLQVSPYGEFAGAVSPDGRWLAYMSDESGGFEVYVRPFPDAQTAKWQVSVGGGVYPVWSRDGRELFYQNTVREELVAVPVLPGGVFATGEPRALFSAAGYVGRANDRAAVAPAPDGRRFLMVRRVGSAQQDQVTVVENFFEVLRGRAP